jgi:hypothetical protein
MLFHVFSPPLKGTIFYENEEENFTVFSDVIQTLQNLAVSPAEWGCCDKRKRFIEL